MIEFRKIFDGDNWSIYYLRINNFIRDLSGLGEVLEKLSSIGRIVAIIPNVELLRTSIFSRAKSQVVSGLAIILEKKKVFRKPPIEV